MRANQRKAILMILDVIDRDLPTLDAVAVFAVGPELAHVNVCVTVAAMRADIGEHQRRMAFRTAHVLVHTAQRIASLVVIELGQRADRLPTRVGMAVLAGCDRWPVGIRHLRPRACSRLRLLRRLG